MIYYEVYWFHCSLIFFNFGQLLAANLYLLCSFNITSVDILRFITWHCAHAESSTLGVGHHEYVWCVCLRFLALSNYHTEAIWCTVASFVLKYIPSFTVLHSCFFVCSDAWTKGESLKLCDIHSILLFKKKYEENLFYREFSLNNNFYRTFFFKKRNNWTTSI